MIHRAALLSVALLACAGTAAATPDRIYLSDGSILEKVEVKSETLKTVTYEPEKGRGEKEVDSELVLRVEFTSMPEELAAAEVEAESEAFATAASGMQNFIANLDDKTARKYPWAAAYARYRFVEMMRLMNDIESMVSAVDQLVAQSADSRYVPIAMIEKIEVQMTHGDMAGAKASTKAFGDLVSAKGLALRWQYEHQLREILTGGATGAALEDALGKLSRKAATFPTVENRADVAIAESMAQRGSFDEAEEIFREITEDPNAFDNTLAAAWGGLGASLFRRAQAKSSAGDDEDAKKLYSDARLAFMRVVVNYPYEYGQVAKAAFFAGRCFQEIGGEDSRDRSSRLFRFVMRNFPNARWAQEAREYNRRNK